MSDPYDDLAGVYAWLVPDELLEPADAVAAFAPALPPLAPGSGLLDCAAGTGQLAVGLALAGHRVVASDASPGMIAETQRLATRHGAELETVVCAWDDLAATVSGPFDVVLCVGNSLTHAAGAAARRRALTQMRHVLADDGTLVVTSRNWERLLARRPALEIGDRLVHRHDRDGLVVYAWTLADDQQAPHHLEVAVARIGPEGAVDVVRERLTFHPFTRDELDDDLRAADLEPLGSTWTPDDERYLVTARPVRR
jgi:SAM-dependent methyltransferase